VCFWTNYINSGVVRVARGGSGAKAPPLAARPKLAGWVAIFQWFIETTLAGWVLASSVCAQKLAGWVKKAASMCQNDLVLDLYFPFSVSTPFLCVSSYTPGTRAILSRRSNFFLLELKVHFSNDFVWQLPDVHALLGTNAKNPTQPGRTRDSTL